MLCAVGFTCPAVEGFVHAIEIRDGESLLVVQLTVFRAEFEQSCETPATPVPGQGLASPRTGPNDEITVRPA